MKKITAAFALFWTLVAQAGPDTRSPVIGPYLQNATQTSIVIMWETDRPDIGRIEYGLSRDSLSFAVSEKRPANLHEIAIANLSAGTEYFYRCCWGDECTQVWKFKTAPSLETEKVTIATYGDSRSNPAMHTKIATLIAKTGPDFVLHSGDIVVDGRKLELWKSQFFDPIEPFAAEIPIYPVLGNHERNAAYYYAFYSLNNNEAWWSFNYGQVHIIGLDSNQPGGPGTEQYEWLVKDLEANNNMKWKIAMFHHPLFNAHANRAVHDLRWSWHPIFQKYGVDLVINGHDHYYARSLQIGQASQYQRGVTYVISAGGGASLYPTGSKDYIAYRRSVHHFTLFQFDGDQMLAKAIDADDKVFDSFVINKQASVSPEEFISYDMMELQLRVEEQISTFSLKPINHDKIELKGEISVPLPFKIPVAVHMNWEVPPSWKMSVEKIDKQLSIGDTLSIHIEAIAQEKEKYPLPNLHIEIDGDNERWTPPSPPLGFRNTSFTVNIEDALFASALRNSGASQENIVGFRFIKDFPGSRYTPQILGRFHQFIQNTTDQEVLVSDLKNAIGKMSDDAKRVLFYPPLFLLGDFSQWDQWLELAQKSDLTAGKAMAPNLVALLRSEKTAGGLVRNWQIIGPFDNTNDRGYYNEYEPEHEIDLHALYKGAEGEMIRWQKATPNVGEYLDFTKIFKQNEVGVVYALTNIKASRETVAPLLLGSNDAAVVWVNGEQVYRLHQHRGATAGEDLIIAQFHKGDNSILVKVDQVGGGWGLYLHILDKDGALEF